MLTRSKERRRQKSQSQSTLFLCGLVFFFNRGMSMHGGSLNHHSHISFMKLLALAINFKAKETPN